MTTRYKALATDYDDTIAHDGRVDAATLAALQRARAGGLRLLLVTGRELTQVFNSFDQVEVFDRVVAENGAVLFEPASTAVRTLAAAPPPALLRVLADANVPVSVGHSIIATVEPHQHTMLEAIRQAGLEWHVIFNKGAVMALPSGVNKASGLACALEEIHVAVEDTVGVGDAENDHAFLAACGLSVAVANALPSLKEGADLVTAGARGEGVCELIERMLSGDIDSVPASPRPLR